jgi:hypothetical protein
MAPRGTKKEWVAPELLVMVRSHPQEAVLSVCKSNGASTGAGNVFSHCAVTDCFTACNGIADS